MEWPTCPPPSSPSPATPAAAETVLPHADIDPTQLANQASHLTLSAVEPGSPSLLASSAAPPPSEPDSQDSPLRQATSCWIEPLSESTPITICTPGPAAAAQPVPHTSHDHTREELLMRDGGLNAVGQEKEGDSPWPAFGADSDCRELIISSRTSMDSRPRFVNSNAIVRLSDLPNEVLLHILGFLDVPDLLATSRVSEPASCCLAVAVSPSSSSPKAHGVLGTFLLSLFCFTFVTFQFPLVWCPLTVLLSRSTNFNPAPGVDAAARGLLASQPSE